MYINGEWVNSSSGKKIESLNPENNEVWATVPEADEKDVDKAVQSAQSAFENNWSKTLLIPLILKFKMENIFVV